MSELRENLGISDRVNVVLLRTSSRLQLSLAQKQGQLFSSNNLFHKQVVDMNLTE